MKKIVIGLILISMSAVLTACGNRSVKQNTEKTTDIQILTGFTTEADATEDSIASAGAVATDEASDPVAAVEPENVAQEETKSDVSTQVEFPGPDVIRIVNLRGDETTVYKLADGNYMDREDRVFTFNGSDAWYDENGVEWNEKVQ